MAEMAHHFGLPNFGTAGTSDAQTLDGQAILEATSSCMMAILSDANLIHDVGLLGSATIVMPEMIVATDEIIAMIDHLLADVATNEEAFAFNVTAEVGPGGEFVTHAHTFDHFHDVWYPELLFRSGSEAWSSRESPTFERRVNERTRDLIEHHQPEPLSSNVVEEIEQIVAQAEAEIG